MRNRQILQRFSLHQTGATSPFRSGGLEVDLTRRLVKVRGRVVRLTPTEYNLLKALIQAAGRVLTHQQLLRQVWARPIPQPAICCG